MKALLIISALAALWLIYNWIKTLIKSKGVSTMNKVMKITIVVVLVTVVAMVIAVKQQNKNSSAQPASAEPARQMTAEETQQQSQKTAEAAKETIKEKTKTISLPKLVDLGADKCIPCKMMAPILEDLKKEYAGTFRVELIDVWKNPDAGKKYGIRLIPTQLFFDAAGKELFRHEGFYSREDILAKWKELSVDIGKTQE